MNSAQSDKSQTNQTGEDKFSVWFVLYINDLPDAVNNEVFLFADDTKIYTQINNITDAESLQHDLDSLQTWSEKWLLSFHPEKCQVLRLGYNDGIDFNYKLGDTTLQETT